jgi:hypothetical protein
MEFAVRNSAGKLEKHFIDPRTGIVHKVGIVYIAESYIMILYQITSAKSTTKTTNTTTNSNKSPISNSNM